MTSLFAEVHTSNPYNQVLQYELLWKDVLTSPLPQIPNSKHYDELACVTKTEVKLRVAHMKREERN